MKLRWLFAVLFVVPCALSFVPGLPAHGFGHVWLLLPAVFWVRRPRQRTRLLLYVGGLAVQWLAFPAPDFGFLGWVLLVPYLLARERDDGASRRRAAFLYGFLRAHLGFLWLGTTHFLPWFGVSLGSGLLFAFVFEEFVARFRGRLPYAFRVAVGWLLFEWCHAWFLGGFPWLYLAHTQYRALWVIQAADVFGAFGITFLLAYVQAAALDAVRRRAWTREALAAAVLLAADLAYGAVRLPPPAPAEKHVLLVQSAYPQEVKERRQLLADEMFTTLNRLTRDGLRGEPRVDLVVWPETILPAVYLVDEQRLWFPESLRPDTGGLPAVFGTNAVPGADDAERMYNAMLLTDATGRPRTLYAKQRLVPMGEEFLPRRVLPDAWADAWFDALVAYTGLPRSCDLRAGEAFVVLDAGPGLRGAPLICFEGLYPHLARRALAAGDADFLLHVVNNGWFGPGEPEQALAAWVFRAVETRTPFLSCANAGISCAVDPGGRIRAALRGVFEEGALVAPVPPRGPHPPFLRGGWWWLPALLAAAGGVLLGRRRRA